MISRPSATIAAFHAPIVLASRSPSGTSPRWAGCAFSTFFLVPNAELGCWPFQAGHHFVATYSPNGVRAFSGVRLGRPRELVAAAALDRALLSQRALLGREDARRTVPPAVLVADLVALARVPGRWRDCHDPGHVGCLFVRDGLMTRDPHSA